MRCESLIRHRPSRLPPGGPPSHVLYEAVHRTCRTGWPARHSPPGQSSPDSPGFAPLRGSYYTPGEHEAFGERVTGFCCREHERSEDVDDSAEVPDGGLGPPTAQFRTVVTSTPIRSATSL
jgi:hypothetical protein